MSRNASFQVNHLKGNNHPLIDDDYNYDYFIENNENQKKQNEFEKKYEKVLNICFSEKPQLIKFDSNTTDEDVDRFFDSL